MTNNKEKQMSEIPHEKPLKRIKTPGLYHVVDWVEVPGPNQKMHGDCSGLWGDCSELSGDCSGLNGCCSGIRGDCSGLWGDCSELRGDCSELSGDRSDLSGDLSSIPTELRKQHPVLEHWINTEENE